MYTSKCSDALYTYGNYKDSSTDALGIVKSHIRSNAKVVLSAKFFISLNLSAMGICSVCHIIFSYRSINVDAHKTYPDEILKRKRS